MIEQIEHVAVTVDARSVSKIGVVFGASFCLGAISMVLVIKLISTLLQAAWGLIQ